MRIEFELNGRPVRAEAEGLAPLAEVLREQLSLTGTKVPCGEGFCGACTVLLDDRPAVACLLPAVHADGRAVRTVEGLADGDTLSPLQQAFKDADAVQCGMCFPGVLMALTGLLEHERDPSDASVRTALVGNVCRCTGYERIVSAALAAASGRDA